MLVQWSVNQSLDSRLILHVSAYRRTLLLLGLRWAPLACHQAGWSRLPARRRLPASWRGRIKHYKGLLGPCPSDEQIIGPRHGLVLFVCGGRTVDSQWFKTIKWFFLIELFTIGADRQTHYNTSLKLKLSSNRNFDERIKLMKINSYRPRSNTERSHGQPVYADFAVSGAMIMWTLMDYF